MLGKIYCGKAEYNYLSRSVLRRASRQITKLTNSRLYAARLGTTASTLVPLRFLPFVCRTPAMSPVWFKARSNRQSEAVVLETRKRRSLHKKGEFPGLGRHAKRPDGGCRHKTSRATPPGWMMPLKQRIDWQIEKSFLPILIGMSTAAPTEKLRTGVDYEV
jgi:hypothetical protein